MAAPLYGARCRLIDLDRTKRLTAEQLDAERAATLQPIAELAANVTALGGDPNGADCYPHHGVYNEILRE